MQLLLKPHGWAIFHSLSTSLLAEQEKHHSWRAEISNQIAGADAHWHHYYTEQELTDVLRVTGFQTVEVTLRGHALICCVHL